MNAPIDPEPPRKPSSSGPSRWGRRRRSQSGAPWLLLLLVAVVLGGAAWWWFGWRDSSPEADAGPVSPVAATRTDTAAPGPREVEPLELPTLEESDGVVRSAVETLSRHPRWAEWLVSDRLARRFVASVANVAAGADPRAQVPFLAPEGEFEVESGAQGTVIDPSSYRRYDPLVAAFVSFDTPAAVRLYQQMLPLFEEAHRELGFPENTFGATLSTAIDNVLAVDVPATPPRVDLDVKTYLYVDPALETATPAAKQVMRLGPENARQVQAKLRELRDGLVAAGAIPRR